MKIEIEVKVSKSNSRYRDPQIKKQIIIDVPGTDFESLNLPNYIQTTLETSIAEFKQLPKQVKEEVEAEEDEIPF